jgi:hypothetical protein
MGPELSRKKWRISSHQLSLRQQSPLILPVYSKSQKLRKAVILHLPVTTFTVDISNGLVNLGRQTFGYLRRSPAEGTKIVNVLLFIRTLCRTSKSHEIFKLTSLFHIAIRLEAYNVQTGLTRCYNCQQFSHVWVNCKKTPRCMWCGAVTCTRDARNRAVQYRHRHAATVS